jgi:hypothetical protein
VRKGLSVQFWTLFQCRFASTLSTAISLLQLVGNKGLVIFSRILGRGFRFRSDDDVKACPSFQNDSFALRVG